MLKSMTGYGNGKISTAHGKFFVEIQTINRKHLEININLPKELIQIENVLHKLVSENISRGKINVYIEIDRASSKSHGVRIDYDLARKYLDGYKAIGRKLKIKGEVDINDIINARNVIQYEEMRLDPKAVAPHLLKALKSALAQAQKMRVKEGAAIKADIRKRLIIIEKDLAIIEKLVPKTVRDFEAKLRLKIKEFESLKTDNERIAKEVSIFADKIDISEEIVRLHSHIKQFNDTLSKNEPVGKIMDFIIQEMMRETNTIASKSNSVEISKRAINIKSEIEKLREQIQNIE